VEREFNAVPEGVLNMSITRREKNENFIVSFIVSWHSKDASIQDVSMMHFREVCVGAMVQTPNFAAMRLSCLTSPQKSG
jgi:hypothetical protein